MRHSDSRLCWQMVHKPEVDILSLDGHLDAETSVLLRHDFEIWRQELQRYLVIDLGGVVFLDSCGAGLLAHMAKSLKIEGQSLALCGLSGQPLDVVKILRLDQVWPIFGTRQIALQRLGAELTTKL